MAGAKIGLGRFSWEVERFWNALGWFDVDIWMGTFWTYLDRFFEFQVHFKEVESRMNADERLKSSLPHLAQRSLSDRSSTGRMKVILWPLGDERSFFSFRRF